MVLNELTIVVRYKKIVKSVTQNKRKKNIAQKRTSGFKPVELASKSSAGSPSRFTSPRLELGGGWWNPPGIMSHCAAVSLPGVDCCGQVMAECKSLILSQLQLMQQTKTTTKYAFTF